MSDEQQQPAEQVAQPAAQVAAEPAPQQQPQVIQVTTPAAPQQRQGVDPDRYAEAKALAEQAAKQAEVLQAQLAEHTAAAARALELAKRNAKLAAVPGLLKESYVALMPDIELDESGALTTESREALSTWRKDHTELFKAAAGGNTPGFEASERASYLDDDQMLMLAGVGVKDVDAWERNVPQAVVNKIKAARRNRKVTR
jgi:hypothetical protein